MPEIGQHPSGRGKMGYYPDHALALVRRIVALKKEGQPLKQAASQAGHEFEQREESGRPSMLDPIIIESICKGIRIGPAEGDRRIGEGRCGAIKPGRSSVEYYLHPGRQPAQRDWDAARAGLGFDRLVAKSG